ncbi:MAG: alpha/beta hydrolase [Lachnospiraceae bacterium]|nr:alpha/beta hydrolase [Lachnospiraceae bacterium]
MGCRIQLAYLNLDKLYDGAYAPADYETLDIVSEGCHLYGEILWPGGSFTAPRPCVILLHGYPGSAQNGDLGQALRRIGCVVLLPHHRGAWGSEGKYLVSHCIQDAVNIAEYVRREAFVRRMNIDPDAIFLAGHSMGGNTVLNAGKQLPWLRGIIAIAPFDPTRFLREGKPEKLRAVLGQGRVLKSDGPDAIYEDIVSHRDDYGFENAYEELKDQNLCFVTGSLDECAPPEEMVRPLYELLAAHPTAALQRWEDLPAAHGLCDCRVEMTRLIAEFIKTLTDRGSGNSVQGA